jgi:hypothetical protein
MPDHNPLDLREPKSAIWADRLKGLEYALLAMVVVTFGIVATIAVARCIWPGVLS